ncbi:MAG: hypothetical protein EIB84_05995 [Spiroplasma poulsonii]|uniref:Uncharacterized protein n=1 Tax=Spiroplasma poulsonii TaxID=2138 RepID=A0A2P6FDU2_9MOLU|nr:hypothetical protein [Spiroplasma poulsonii]KAF0850613.1 hypothetical protein MSROBK_014970 [Spiroplasma poulsonii]MBW1242317.1 hypothetical protein [Spiroplasma poulsonii]PQM31625.1 hypothetical protein SMSRO_SF014700 [Spiroplasma poulsonii]PWF96649.1 hypothetical protein SMSE_20960 [Spiroplasma poulsonii]PWF97225.1 hypothetical protein SMH99_20340 [Spiroplasma poulsonii]
MSKINAITELFLHEAAQNWDKSKKEDILEHADTHLETTIRNYLKHTNINSNLLNEMADQGYTPLENVDIATTSNEKIIDLVTANLKELIYNNLKQNHIYNSEELTR